MRILGVQFNSTNVSSIGPTAPGEILGPFLFCCLHEHLHLFFRLRHVSAIGGRRFVYPEVVFRGRLLAAVTVPQNSTAYLGMNGLPLGLTD